MYQVRAAPPGGRCVFTDGRQQDNVSSVAGWAFTCRVWHHRPLPAGSHSRRRVSAGPVRTSGLRHAPLRKPPYRQVRRVFYSGFPFRASKPTVPSTTPSRRQHPSHHSDSARRRRRPHAVQASTSVHTSESWSARMRYVPGRRPGVHSSASPFSCSQAFRAAYAVHLRRTRSDPMSHEPPPHRCHRACRTRNRTTQRGTSSGHVRLTIWPSLQGTERPLGGAPTCRRDPANAPRRLPPPVGPKSCLRPSRSCRC